MNKTSMKTLATATLLIALGGLTEPAAAKSITRLPASCGAGTAGYGIFQKQGKQFTVGFGASGPGSVGTWHVRVTDNGSAALIDGTYDIAVPAWSASTSLTLGKGGHALVYQADNLTTGESCVLTTFTKV